MSEMRNSEKVISENDGDDALDLIMQGLYIFNLSHDSGTHLYCALFWSTVHMMDFFSRIQH